MKKIIIGENIIKSFGDGDKNHKVLDGVSIQINEGEFVSIMGPSGSGKSTLMFALSGMDGIEGGKVTFDGRDLTALKENEYADIRRNCMGFIFQQPTFLKNLDILDNIILPTMRDNRKNVAKITERARTLMKKVGISDLEHRDITQVSGGQLQRAGICRALMSNPRIVFGDEPTGALNSKSANEIMGILSDINSDGTTVMLVTHDAKIAARTERVMFMSDGKMVSELLLQKYNGTDIDDRTKRVTARMQEIGI